MTASIPARPQAFKECQCNLPAELVLQVVGFPSTETVARLGIDAMYAKLETQTASRTWAEAVAALPDQEDPVGFSTFLQDNTYAEILVSSHEHGLKFQQGLAVCLQQGLGVLTRRS